jgi:hypothetical protein
LTDNQKFGSDTECMLSNLLIIIVLDFEGLEFGSLKIPRMVKNLKKHTFWMPFQQILHAFKDYSAYILYHYQNFKSIFFEFKSIKVRRAIIKESVLITF